MRIAVYSHYYAPEIGAPSARIGELGAEWLKLGHEVHVVTCFPNHPTGKVYPGYRLRNYQHDLIDGISVHRNRTYITPNKGILKKTLGHASLWLSAGCHGTRRMPAPACAIGTSPTFFAAMAARACARRCGVPYIMEVRDLWPAIFSDLGIVTNRILLKALERWEMNLYRTAARIVTVTDSFRNNLVHRGISGEKVVTITNGADSDFWRPSPDGARLIRERLGLKDSFVVLYIGVHGISQGLGAIVKAAERLRGNPRVQFVLVGEGADKRSLIAESARLKMENIRFIDAVDKASVRDYYTMADVCTVPLRNVPLFDTFIPSKMFEIMSVGRPIVASVCGEAAEILTRSGAAAVVAPEDDAAIAAAITELLDAPVRRERMGREGRGFVMTYYSRSELARRYLDVIAGARREMGLPAAN